MATFLLWIWSLILIAPYGEAPAKQASNRGERSGWPLAAIDGKTEISRTMKIRLENYRIIFYQSSSERKWTEPMRFDGSSFYPNLPPRRPASKLRTHGFALRGGRKILGYYEMRIPRHAGRVRNIFETELRQIEARPHDYPKYLIDNLRKCVVKDYLIFFTVRPPFIVILCVRDGARRPPDKLLVKLANAKRLAVWPYRPDFRKDQLARPEKV